MALAEFKLFDTVAEYLVTAVLLFAHVTTGAYQATSVSCKIFVCPTCVDVSCEETCVRMSDLWM